MAHYFFFFSSRRRHTRCSRDWSSDVCSSDLLPNGADAVVPQENVTADGERITIPRPVERGAFVRPAGEDVRVGDVVVEAGETISAPQVGLPAALGHARVRVHPPPPVPLLSTGHELAH